MLGDREKVGGSSTAHKLSIRPPGVPLVPPKVRRVSLAFGPPETKRKDIRETEYEHYIRELPLAGGGLGCALWDGGLVLARWVFLNGDAYLRDKRVLELGAGVGLAGIMAAHWAASVVLTDYISETVRNAMYNVELNDASEDDEDKDVTTTTAAAVAAEEGSGTPSSMDNNNRIDDQQDAADDGNGSRASAHNPPALNSHRPRQYRRRISGRVTGRLLDWDKELLDAQGLQARDGVDAAFISGSLSSSNCVVCTAAKSHLGDRLPPVVQEWFWCKTCWPNDESCGVCAPCAARCHATHELIRQAPERFLCDCLRLETTQPSPATDDSAAGATAAQSWECRAMPPQPPLEAKGFDIIIGSELTYSLLSCESLAFVVDKYLTRTGAFYEVLSDDRDGVAVFIAAMEQRGFETHRVSAPSVYLGNYSTRKWCKQNLETYSLYTWRRRDVNDTDKPPLMQ